MRVIALFVLFYLGLEANLTCLIEAGRSILVGGTIYVGINFTAGFTFGYLVGFPLREALIITGLTTVSSSAIVAKILFDYRRMANPETQIVLGITMFDDVFLAVYLSLISGIVLSGATFFTGSVLWRHGPRLQRRLHTNKDVGRRRPTVCGPVCVLILASASPLLAKESERIYGLLAKIFKRLRKRKKADEEVEEAEV